MVGKSFNDTGRRRRKSARRVFAYPAELQFDSGAKSGPCVIVDISELGAQIEVPPGTHIPDEFALLIGGHASVKRRCLTVWRSETRVGVRFHGAPERLPRQELSGQLVLRSQFELQKKQA
jgi:hypothetical protein